MIKKFTLLLLAMLCVAGTNAKEQLSLVNPDKSWGSSYNTSTRVITFNSETYRGMGWNYGKSVSSNPYLVVEFANSTEASKVQVYADETGTNAETGKSYIICDLTSKGETAISELVIKNKEASAVVTLKDAFLLTASEYADYINIKARKTDIGFDKWTENWGEISSDKIDTESHSVTLGANSEGSQAYGWGIWSTPGGKTLVFELDGNQKDCKLEIMEGNVVKKTENISGGQKYVIVDISSYLSTSLSRFLFRNKSTAEDNTITFRQAYYSNQTEENETKYLTKVKATIGSSGYTAFSCDQALDFTGVDGVTAYIVSSTDGENAFMTPVNKVPANTGLILAGTANASYWIPITTESTDDVSSNKLQCAIDATNVQASDVSSSRYILAKQSGDTGFYKLEEEGSKLVAGTDTKKYHTLSCNKSYLEVTSLSKGSLSYMKMSIGGNGNTTGISNTMKESSVQDNIYYSLNGTAVKNPSKGLYIINGKKVIIK